MKENEIIYEIKKYKFFEILFPIILLLVIYIKSL